MRELMPEAVAALHEAGKVILLDVREPWEWELCHVAGAVHIPMGQIPARRAELPADRPVVVMCHHGMRSHQVAQFLEAEGHADVANLVGGIDAWARSVDTGLALY